MMMIERNTITGLFRDKPIDTQTEKLNIKIVHAADLIAEHLYEVCTASTFVVM